MEWGCREVFGVQVWGGTPCSQAPRGRGDALSGAAWRDALSSPGGGSLPPLAVFGAVGVGLRVGGGGAELWLRSPSAPHNQDPIPAGQVPPGVK